MSELFSENPILGGLAIIILMTSIYSGYTVLIIISMIILVSLLLFYRVPINRREEFSTDVIYGPCYGTVSHIINTDRATYITIFLSIFDIHSQYYPISGTLIDRQYDMSGKFALAFDFDKASENEKAIHTIMADNGDVIKITQIAGLLARRITYDDKRIGNTVKVGDRMGMIHFGSRVDIELPKNYQILIKEGNYINGPNTLIARRLKN